MEVVAAAGDLLQQILDGSYPLWGDGLTREAYEKFNLAQQSTRWGRRHLDRVALVDHGRLLSSAKRYSISVTIDGRRCRALGIAAVFTPSERRGHGFARQLLDIILARATRDGYDVALLFSEISPDYYARHGFMVVSRDTLQLEVARSRGAPGIVVRGGDARDFTPIAQMHQELAVRYRFSVDRTTEWIEYAIAKKRLMAGLAEPGTCDVLFYVVEEGGRAVAYVVVTTAGSGWTIEECGDRDPSGARVGALLQTLIAREPIVEAPSCYAWMPERWLPPQLSIVSRAAASQVLMVRPLGDRARPVRPLAPSDLVYWHADAF